MIEASDLQLKLTKGYKTDKRATAKVVGTESSSTRVRMSVTIPYSGDTAISDQTQDQRTLRKKK